MSLAEEHRTSGTITASYLVVGVPVTVTADAQTLEFVDEIYATFRTRSVAPESYAIRVRQSPGGVQVTDSEGRDVEVGDEREAGVLTIERVVRHATGQLAARGVYAIHAAALVHRGECVAIAGRTHAGKTTLALALVGRGLGLLSDELALSAPDERTILPYPRGVHVRPGTPERIPELAFISDLPFHPFSGGRQWTLRADEIARVFPGCFGEPAPLRHVVLLERAEGAESVLEPVDSGVAVVELVRATTAAADDLPAATKRVSRLVDGARCIRLRSGELASSVDVLLAWLGRDDA